MDKNLYAFYLVGIFCVPAISIIIYCISCKHDMKRITYRVMGVLIALSIYMIFAQYLKYRSLHFYIDFSCWSQLLNNIATSGRPLSLNEELIHPGFINYFSAHFVPLVYILALPFKLWPHNETLIIMNFLLMASSIIPLYKLASIDHKDKQFGLFLVTLLLWYPTFQYIVLYEFEVLRFSIPIIIWMLYFLNKRRMILYFIFVLLAVLVREEVGLTVMMFGLYLLLFEKRYQAGLTTALIGLGAFIIIVGLIMPALRATTASEHVAARLFKDFGNTVGAVAVNVLIHPTLTLTKIFQPIKLANIFMYFLPLLFVPMLAATVLIGTLANFGMCMLSDSITHSSYMLYYLSPSVPFIFYAFIKGWPKLLVLLSALTKRMHHSLKVDISTAAMMGVLAGLLVVNVFFGPSPVSLQFWFRDLGPAPFRTQNFHYLVYKITEHHRKAEEFCSLIPDSAVVSAHSFLFPRLFEKRGTMIFPRLESSDGTIKADYVFFDKTNNGLNNKSPSYQTQSTFNMVEKDKKNWQLEESGDGFFLYKRLKR
jgi:uncharacterized membrane protein